MNSNRIVLKIFVLWPARAICYRAKLRDKNHTTHLPLTNYHVTTLLLFLVQFGGIHTPAYSLSFRNTQKTSRQRNSPGGGVLTAGPAAGAWLHQHGLSEWCPPAAGSRGHRWAVQGRAQGGPARRRRSTGTTQLPSFVKKERELSNNYSGHSHFLRESFYSQERKDSSPEDKAAL